MREHRISAEFLHALLGRKAAAELLRSEGLEPNTQSLDHLRFWRMLRDGIDLTGDERLHTGPEHIPIGSFELFLSAMTHGRSLEDGLERLAQTASITQPDLNIEAVRLRGIKLIFRSVKTKPTPQHLYIELLAMLIHIACCWMAGRVLRPAGIIAAPCRAACSGEVYCLLGCEVQRSGSDVILAYGREDALRPLSADRFDLWRTLLFETYRQVTAANEPQPQRSYHELVRHCLLSRPMKQAEVAKHLDMSVATLRRQLAKEGHSFRALQAQIRRQLALEALSSDARLEDIAVDLGYSEGRSLRRAITKWFGLPPSALRGKSG